MRVLKDSEGTVVSSLIVTFLPLKSNNVAIAKSLAGIPIIQTIGEPQMSSKVECIVTGQGLQTLCEMVADGTLFVMTDHNGDSYLGYCEQPMPEYQLISSDLYQAQFTLLVMDYVAA